MKTIIKLAIAAVFLAGAFNFGRALLTDYQFEDAVQQGMLFDPRMTDAEIVALVTKAAQEHDVPLEPSDVVVTQQGPDIRVQMPYSKSVAIIPGVYSTPWTVTPSASARLLVGNRRSP
jgi:hypothetical protein